MVNSTAHCTRCKLSKTRLCVVRSYGTYPADVLFLWESPTKTDEHLFKMGRSPEAKLLFEMLAEAADILSIPCPSFHIHPMVMCRPTTMKFGPDRPPQKDEVLACAVHVLEAVRKVQPKQIFFTSKLVAAAWREELPDALTLLPMEMLERQGGKQSPYYLLTLRKLMEGLAW